MALSTSCKPVQPVQWKDPTQINCSFTNPTSFNLCPWFFLLCFQSWDFLFSKDDYAMLMVKLSSLPFRVLTMALFSTNLDPILSQSTVIFQYTSTHLLDPVNRSVPPWGPFVRMCIKALQTGTELEGSSGNRQIPPGWRPEGFLMADLAPIIGC